MNTCQNGTIEPYLKLSNSSSYLFFTPKELALAIDGKLKKVMQMKAKIRQSVLAAIKAEPIWLDFFNGLGLFMEILLMLTKIAKKKAALFFLS